MKLNEIKLGTSPTFLTDAKEIQEWLEHAFEGENVHPSYDINEADWSVDIHGDLNISDWRAITGREFNVKLGKIKGTLNASRNNLTNNDLDFLPSHADKLVLTHNKLTSLKNVPPCSNELEVHWNKMTSFKGFQGAHLIRAQNNPMTSLIGVNEQLKSLGQFINSRGPLLCMSFDEITEGGIGLMMLPHLQKIRNIRSTVFVPLPDPFKIINKYLGYPDKIFECQQELIEAGFEEYAQL